MECHTSFYLSVLIDPDSLKSATLNPKVNPSNCNAQLYCICSLDSQTLNPRKLPLCKRTNRPMAPVRIPLGMLPVAHTRAAYSNAAA